MKEKLLTNYGETMKLKADTGNSYCEGTSSPPPKKCSFKFRKITIHSLFRWIIWSRHERQSHFCWYVGPASVYVL